MSLRIMLYVAVFLGTLGLSSSIYEYGAESPKNALAKMSKFQAHRQFFKIYAHGYKNIRFFSKKMSG